MKLISEEVIRCGSVQKHYVFFLFFSSGNVDLIHGGNRQFFLFNWNLL